MYVQSVKYVSRITYTHNAYVYPFTVFTYDEARMYVYYSRYNIKWGLNKVSWYYGWRSLVTCMRKKGEGRGQIRWSPLSLSIILILYFLHDLSSFYYELNTRNSIHKCMYKFYAPYASYDYSMQNNIMTIITWYLNSLTSRPHH